MKDIGKLFDEYGSDKNENHGYGKYYDKHLPLTVDKFLEIGVWKGSGIKSFKEYYDNKGEFHAMDWRFGGEVISVEELHELKIIPHEGSQSDIPFLNTITDLFSVCVEDGSHHSDEQVITFKHIFINNIKSGGLYVLEDTHCCFEEYWWRGIITKFEDTALAIFKSYINGGTLESQFITKEESELLISLIDEVNIYNDAIIFIKKK